MTFVRESVNSDIFGGLVIVVGRLSVRALPHTPPALRTFHYSHSSPGSPLTAPRSLLPEPAALTEPACSIRVIVVWRHEHDDILEPAAAALVVACPWQAVGFVSGVEFPKK